MAKIRKSLIGALMCLILLLIGVCALTACGSKDYTVTFSIEGKEQTVDVVDGKVTFPADPSKEYYEFRGWYSTDTFEEGTEFTKDTEIKESVKVYAYFAPIYVNISVNGSAAEEIKLENLSARTTEYTADAENKNLTFDGWYIDANCGTNYTTQDVDNLYARYLATVIFDNGYEVLYTQTVTENSKLTAPHISVDNFIKTYMDEDDISYVDENGDAVDFDTFTVTQNTTLKVLWKSPRLTYTQIGNSGKYYVSGLNLTGLSNVTELPYPAVSILSKNVTMKDGTKGEVVGVGDCYAYLFKQAKTIIFNEGIEYISDFYMGSDNIVENLVLPSTLKVIENSFMNLNSLEKLDLPDGLEVVIDSFWSKTRDTKIDATVTIPSTVTNLAIVPAGLDLSQNDKFVYDGGLLYNVENGEKILCSVYQSNVTDNRLVIAEGVTGIQVGILENIDYDYLELPSSFRTVGYNNRIEDYPSYSGSRLTESAVAGDSSVAPDNIKNTSSYAIVGNLDELKYVTVNLSAMPSSVSDYAFVGSGGIPYNGGAFAEDEKVVFISNVTAGESVNVVIKKVAVMDGITQIITLDTYNSGDTLTEEDIVSAAGLSADEHYWTITVLGNAFADGQINCNQYITLEYRSSKVGYTYVDNGDGTATVTGFNEADAELLEDGTYRVNIHNNTTDYLTIVAIKDEAFMGNQKISQIYISKSVKTIGARAFKNMSNLTVVNIAEGGLETIGESAFENIGCKDDGEGNWVMNTDAGLTARKGVSFTLPLGNIEYIAPYAFKSRAIVDFTPVESEEGRTLYSVIYGWGLEPEAGEYYFIAGDIVKYVGVSQQTMKDSNGNDVTVNVHDVQYVAYAGGANRSKFGVGFSFRKYSFGGVNVFRFEMMEGSVYFINNIFFGYVSEIHENAFTDCDTTRVYQYNVAHDEYITLEQVQTQDSTIFENGWYNGLDNDDETLVALMQAAQGDDSMLSW